MCRARQGHRRQRSALDGCPYWKRKGLMSKKISPRRLADLPGPRRKKPPVRAQTRWLVAAIEREHQLVQKLRNDEVSRSAYLVQLGYPVDSLLVWNDFDQTHHFTETNPDQLPEWEQLTEYMKHQVAFMAATSLGGYAFSSDIHPAHLEKWIARGTVMDRTVERLKDELRGKGLDDLPFSFMLEGRSRSTKSRTKIHVHGAAIPDTPHGMTRLKVAVENAWHKARGEEQLRGGAWHQDLAYDLDTGDGRGWGRWLNYTSKNVLRYDARIKGRRVYMSRSMTQVAREFWLMLQEKPL